MTQATFPTTCDPDLRWSDLAKLIVRVLGEAGPMEMKEIKRRLRASGQPHVLQAAIAHALRTDLYGVVVRRSEAWGLAGDTRFAQC